MVERIKLPDSLYANATIDDLRFIFSQAKDRISVLTEDAEKLYQRSVVLISICVASITAIIGYIGTHLEFNFSTFLLGTIGAFMWIVISRLKANILPTDYWGIGSEPIAFTTDAFFTDLDGKTPEWHMLYMEIISSQYRIDVNKSNNQIRASNLSDAIAWLYWTPIIALAVLLISGIFGII